MYIIVNMGLQRGKTFIYLIDTQLHPLRAFMLSCFSCVRLFFTP